MTEPTKEQLNLVSAFANAIAYHGMATSPAEMACQLLQGRKVLGGLNCLVTHDDALSRLALRVRAGAWGRTYKSVTKCHPSPRRKIPPAQSVIVTPARLNVPNVILCVCSFSAICCGLLARQGAVTLN